MTLEEKIREVLEKLYPLPPTGFWVNESKKEIEKDAKIIKYGWIKEIDQALSAIHSLYEKSLPEEKEGKDCVNWITHADKELADMQATSMRIGFNSAIKQIKENWGER